MSPSSTVSVIQMTKLFKKLTLRRNDPYGKTTCCMALWLGAWLLITVSVFDLPQNRELNSGDLLTRQRALMSLCDVMHNPEHICEGLRVGESNIHTHFPTQYLRACSTMHRPNHYHFIPIIPSFSPAMLSARWFTAPSRISSKRDV